MLLTLYSTSACHLCELALQVIEQLPQDSLSLEIIDIATKDHLIEQYGVRIPVVQLEQRAHDLGWPFDLAALQAYVSEGE